MSDLLSKKNNDEVHISKFANSSKIYSNALKEKSVLKSIWKDIVGAQSQPKQPKLSSMLNNKPK